LVSGAASLSGQVLPSGAHTVAATFTPSTSGFSGSSGQTSVTITKAATNIALTFAANGSTSTGIGVTLTATLAPQYSGTPTGAVAFYSGTTLLGTAPVTAGKATLTATVPAASQTFKSVYSGDANFQAATATVNASLNVPSVQLSILDTTPAYPVPVAFLVVVKGSAGTPTGTVTVYGGAAKLASCPLFGGATVAPAPVSISLQCASTNSFKYGKPVTCTATVAGLIPAKGVLGWSIDGKAQTSTLNSSGSASVVLSNPTVGAHTGVATYAAPRTATFTITPQ
jgi:hypothetical protein